MANINMLDTGAIRTLANEFNGCADLIRTTVNTLDSTVKTLVPANWNCQAATTFAENWDMDYESYKQKLIAFDQLVGTLNKVANSTDETEQRNIMRASYH